MDMITVSAKTLDEAITKALINLQTTSEHLHYEVIEKGTSGLLGIFGAKPCVIRARVMSEEEERLVKEQKLKKEKEAEKPVPPAKPVREEKPAAPAKPVHEEKVAPVKPVHEEKPTAPAKPVYEDRLATSAKPPVKEPREPKEKPALKVDEAAVSEKAKVFLNQVFEAMGMKVEIETSFDREDGELQVMMSGTDMGILIGKRGQTLDSLQYLVSLVVNKETEGYLRVKVDTENYRERRRETLETLAKNISYKVKRTKRSVSLEPMNPYERRIIHSILQGDKYVTTRSEGEDPYRHVVISLKREGGYYHKKDRNQSHQKEAE